MFNSAITRISGGTIDTVNDEVIGGIAGISGASKFAQQLGQPTWFDDYTIRYTSATPVYGGRFRYVRLAAAATAVVRGQIVFWDISVADSLFQVTTSEAGSTDGAMFRAGIVLNGDWDAGNYSFIQDVGPTYTKFRAVLTQAGAIGDSVYCAAAGAGVDNGFADQIGSANPTLFSDVQLMQGRYLGAAIGLPAGASLTLVNLNFMNLRG